MAMCTEEIKCPKSIVQNSILSLQATSTYQIKIYNVLEKNISITLADPWEGPHPARVPRRRRSPTYNMF